MWAIAAGFEVVVAVDEVLVLLRKFMFWRVVVAVAIDEVLCAAGAGDSPAATAAAAAAAAAAALPLLPLL